jgi:hypothetical protein
MTPLLALVISFFFGLSFSVPWIFVRIGIYKRWYLAPFAPPLMWSRVIFGWPIGAMFVSLPFLYLLGLRGNAGTNASGLIGIIGLVLAVIMIGWTPGWAKPKWQRYIEDKYTGAEIRSTFIPVWRKMDRKKWSQLLDSEEGIEELVRIAREEKYGYP